jgi:hypothetical protein
MQAFSLPGKLPFRAGKNWLVTHRTQDEMVTVGKTRAQMHRLIDGGFKIVGPPDPRLVKW